MLFSAAIQSASEALNDGALPPIEYRVIFVKNIVFLSISFLICLLLGLEKLWIFQALIFVLLCEHIPAGIVHIPLCALFSEVICLFFTDYIPILSRLFFVLGIMCIALTRPRRLAAVFPVAAAVLFWAEDSHACAAYLCAVWCCAYNAYCAAHGSPLKAVQSPH